MAETSSAPAAAAAPASTSRAICAAVNPRSGGNKGRAVLAELTALLGAERVFDLTSELQSPGRLGEQPAAHTLQCDRRRRRARVAEQASGDGAEGDRADARRCRRLEAARVARGELLLLVLRGLASTRLDLRTRHMQNVLRVQVVAGREQRP